MERGDAVPVISAPPLPEPLAALRQVWGYHGFRHEQQAVIEHVMAGGDALVLMPTGGGKSLCYQIPALCRAGVGLVISPLIALMEDQVAALTAAGVAAACLHSALPAGEMAQTLRRLDRRELDLLYVAPERLASERFLALLDRAQIALFAIDEAHCVSQWGHDFRPDYRGLAVLERRYAHVPRLALTATADGATRRDIVAQLGLSAARQFVASFDRPNIRYRVVAKKEARRQLLDFITTEHGGDAGIVYCLSRRKVEEVAAFLAGAGINALPYHAGLDPAVRQAHQRRFRIEEGVVMVATIAFGMGIDKPNVRFVAHLDLPKSLEAYYQETGRAGRDGLPASAWLAYGLKDAVLLRQLMGQSGAAPEQARLERHKLDAMLGYCESVRCRRQVLLDYFGEHREAGCGNCDLCLAPAASFDGTEAAQKALSAAYRTGQRYGAAYLAEVLVGRQSERVHRAGHDALSIFGIGQELQSAEWLSVFRQLIAFGLLDVDAAGTGGLFLTEASRPLLRGEQRLNLRRDDQPTGRKGRQGANRAAPAQGLDRLLWDRLRACRLALARAQGVPPYVIFHDATLLEMVAARPQTSGDLARLSGVGVRKLERYGEAFLAVLRADAA